MCHSKVSFHNSLQYNGCSAVDHRLHELLSAKGIKQKLWPSPGGDKNKDVFECGFNVSDRLVIF